MTRKVDEQEARSLEKISDPEELSNLAAFTSNVDFHTKQELLESVNLEVRIDRLIQILEEELIDIKRRSSS